MAYLDAFAEDMVTATVTHKVTGTYVDGVPVPGTSSNTSISCLYYEGSAAEAYVSARFRDKTSAVIIVSPDVTIYKNDTVVVQGNTYHSLSPDNIGAASEAVVIALEVIA